MTTSTLSTTTYISTTVGHGISLIHCIFLDTEDGATRFGYRDAEIIVTYEDKGYCFWKLTTPEPIYELGIKEVSYTTGYMNLSLLRATTNNESEEPSPKLTYGLKTNAHSDIFQTTVTLEDLFKD